MYFGMIRRCTGFLRTEIQRNTQEGTITMTQTGLINMILEVTGFEDSNIKFTLVDKVPLQKDEDGPPCKE